MIKNSIFLNNYKYGRFTAELRKVAGGGQGNQKNLPKRIHEEKEKAEEIDASSITASLFQEYQ